METWMIAAIVVVVAIAGYLIYAYTQKKAPFGK